MLMKSRVVQWPASPRQTRLPQAQHFAASNKLLANKIHINREGTDRKSAC